MTISTRNTTRKGETFRQQMYGYSVLELDETHHGMGIGYHAQQTVYNSDAMDEGWVLLTDGLRKDEADLMRDDLRDIEYAQTADFDFGHPYTEDEDDECPDCGYDLRYGQHQVLQSGSWLSPSYYCSGTQVEVVEPTVRENGTVEPGAIQTLAAVEKALRYASYELKRHFHSIHVTSDLALFLGAPAGVWIEMARDGDTAAVMSAIAEHAPDALHVELVELKPRTMVEWK